MGDCHQRKPALESPGCGMTGWVWTAVAAWGFLDSCSRDSGEAGQSQRAPSSTFLQVALFTYGLTFFSCYHQPKESRSTTNYHMKPRVLRVLMMMTVVMVPAQHRYSGIWWLALKGI